MMQRAQETFSCAAFSFALLEATMDDFVPNPARGRSTPHDATRRRVRRRDLAELQPLVKQGKYRIGSHAVRHAACEGFTERDIVATVMYGRELMRYPHDERMLVLGWLPVSAAVKIPLHVVLEYRKPRWVDVVTAFIPADPHRAVSRTRLAEILRHDRHEVERTVVGPLDGSAR